jgi:hypothetical protein
MSEVMLQLPSISHHTVTDKMKQLLSCFSLYYKQIF